MTSRPLKGSVAEKAAETYLTEQGYEVHRARAVMVNPAPGKFFVFSHDVWKAVDLACMSATKGFLFVQVTTISGKSGSLQYGHVAERRKKLEALPWPSQGNGADPSYRIQVWGARNQRKGRLIARWFQVWDFDVARRVWTQEPARIAISGPVPGDVVASATSV